MKKTVVFIGLFLFMIHAFCQLPLEPEDPPQNPDIPDFYKTNLVSALHHASGTMAFTFESPHGTIKDGATHEEILDIQLVLYEEMFEYIFNNRLFWEPN